MKREGETSKHGSVAAWIRQEMALGRLKPGGRLESESELCARFGVSRTSVRKAISDLIAEGLVESRRGVGSFRVGGGASGGAMVGLVCFFSESYVFPSLIAGFDSVMHGAGRQILVAQSECDLNREREVLERLEKSGAKAIAIEPVIRLRGSHVESNRELFEEMRGRGIELILIDDDFDEGGFSSVRMDNYRGGRLMAESLYKRGHRRIALVRDGDLQLHIRRQEGALDYLREQDCLPEDGWILRIDQAEKEDFESVVLPLFSGARPDSGPSAVICTDDQAAILLCNFLRKLGLKVPEDVSVVGFDNSEIARQPSVGLSSIENPSRYVGGEAAAYLLRRLGSGEVSVSARIVIDPVLVERDSIREPPR
jgi:GntR family transcriptional regulator, arabinose operon transcriptional repressor